MSDRTTLDNEKLWTTAVVLKLFHIKDPQNDNYQPAERHLKRHTRNYHLAGDPLELPQGPLGGPRPHFESQWTTVYAVYGSQRA